MFSRGQRHGVFATATTTKAKNQPKRNDNRTSQVNLHICENVQVHDYRPIKSIDNVCLSAQQEIIKRFISENLPTK